MKRHLFFLLSYIFLFLPLPISAQESVNIKEKKICASNLNQEIESIINQPSRQKETWGVVIENLKDNQVLYQVNENKFFIPASNIKLLTTASILWKLGADFSINTPVYIVRESTNTNVSQNSIDSLIIEGKGDPTFSQQQLNIIAEKLKEEGIKEVNNLVLMDGYLSQPTTNYTWEFEDIYFYFAVPVNSLILNNNTVNFTLNHGNINQQPSLQWSDELAGKQIRVENNVYTRDENTEFNITILPLLAHSSLRMTGDFPLNKQSNTWRLAIPNPAQYFQESLIKTLNNYDIKVKNSQIINYGEKLDKNKQFLLEIDSPPLSELIKTTNQDSNNLYAEVLLKYLADSSASEWENLAKITKELGISEDNYKIKDGSGLSRHNLITPVSLVTILKVMNNSQYKEIFYNSLAVAGENGTLKNRFVNTNIANNLSGKTGTLTGVASLSGYLKTPHYDNLAFTIIVNQSIANSTTLRNSIDQIVLLLGQVEKC
ncbi:D-alanyl-D-alanine carboxypeptidase/D-alanyl-D-alanine endopeptidase [Geminocystis herdmanii]|uniref:D-alanyl-D-alanine carboxypeptidase/D-alanyl-D-alanine endopeptidase n=1 Tax=Geminocystis herdmanii TaxID=669359 RepID=UPI000347FB33|nr:D-alanyl-D-alanine carboxypeptidase/D-alanyl-D-alanine-endopeptidase [Geminocystis herdmanii]